jgi:hypothetical protein
VENKAQVATVVLSVISTLLVAFIGIYGSSRLEEIKNQAAAATQEKTIQLEREKLKSEQQARLEKILLQYVPKLVGSNEAERKNAIAILFILYPNDAKTYIDRAAASLGTDEKAVLQTTIEQAQGLDAKTGPWTIVVGSDLSLEDAKAEVQNAAKQGYTPAVIYKRNQWFGTTVGNYPSQEVANSENVAVKSKIRNSAFAVDLGSWCPSRAPRDGYIECTNK